nr:MAG TPA: hypothetical protein [Caudoviricetes sp.]
MSFIGILFPHASMRNIIPQFDMFRDGLARKQCD